MIAGNTSSQTASMDLKRARLLRADVLIETGENLGSKGIDQSNTLIRTIWINNNWSVAP
jgi:hypothetical protein